jgi:hypothetical protein
MRPDERDAFRVGYFHSFQSRNFLDSFGEIDAIFKTVG